MKTKRLLLIMAAGLYVSSFSQVATSKVITGTVLSAENKFPLEGVSILVKGRGSGVPTDNKGQFSIQAAVGDDAYYDGAQTTMAVKKLRELKENGQPFFLSVGFYKPHLPLNAPKKCWDLYNRSDIPLATNQNVPKGSPDFAVHGDAEMRSYIDRKDLPKPLEGRYGDEKQRQLLHAYYACVSYIDAQIGRLLSELDKLGLRENTIIVLWSDHGWKLGEHNSWAKQSNYEIDTRVPFIISGAGVKAKGAKSNALTELVDIYPRL